MSLVLVDTSAWILAVHRRDRRAKEQLKEVVLAGNGAACPIVLVELLAGRSQGEVPEAVRHRFAALTMLDCSAEVWERAYALAAEARSLGQTLPATDALVAAHALVADATLLHADSDFTRIAEWSGLRQESLLGS